MKDSTSLKGLIHHSDHGIQYCRDAYVQMLREHDISISIAEDHKSTDNAVAERVNGIIKTACVYCQRLFSDMDRARSVTGRYIRFYNGHRPHISIEYKPPSPVHQGGGRPGKDVEAEKYAGHLSSYEESRVSLQCRVTGQGEGPGPNG